MMRGERPLSASTAQLFRQLSERGRLDLDEPGGGGTRHRHRSLMEIARVHPVGVARLAEAHCDAIAVLAEAGRTPRPGALYAVWASTTGGSDEAVLSDRALTGVRRFCSGVGIVDRALLIAADDSGDQHLLDVDVAQGRSVRFDVDGWSTTALSDTSTGEVTFVEHPVDDDATIRDPGWYLRRPGFWHGACGPAACWAGAVVGVIDVARSLTGDDPHQLAHLGAMEATHWTFAALLDSAGDEIDAAPGDTVAGEYRARSLRHTVERLSADVLDRFERAFGPRPFVSDPDLAQRFEDCHLYLRQHHAERELAAVAEAGRVARP